LPPAPHGLQRRRHLTLIQRSDTNEV